MDVRIDGVPRGQISLGYDVTVRPTVFRARFGPEEDILTDSLD